ncbi:MAG: hypothetical protein LBS88_05115, partial [Tannerellaceae bacterium]|nr:hypothetical protein [Tannerellaceae bacterium]
ALGSYISQPSGSALGSVMNTIVFIIFRWLVALAFETWVLVTCIILILSYIPGQYIGKKKYLCKK